MEPTPKQQWDRCLEIIRDNITPEQFAASFAFVELHSFENGKLVLNVPSEFVKKFLEDNFLNPRWIEKCIELYLFLNMVETII